MAPEIIKYNGEEEYTEKVDCFSFGMFIYELVTMHQPFENHESVKESILEGHRPALTYRVRKIIFKKILFCCFLYKKYYFLLFFRKQLIQVICLI